MASSFTQVGTFRFDPNKVMGYHIQETSVAAFGDDPIPVRMCVVLYEGGFQVPIEDNDRKLEKFLDERFLAVSKKFSLVDRE